MRKPKRHTIASLARRVAKLEREMDVVAPQAYDAHLHTMRIGEPPAPRRIEVTTFSDTKRRIITPKIDVRRS
jgi:hypothetical protein